MREPLKTVENVSHVCESLSKPLRTFRTRAKCYKSIKNVFDVYKSFLKGLMVFRTNEKYLQK